MNKTMMAVFSALFFTLSFSTLAFVNAPMNSTEQIEVISINVNHASVEDLSKLKGVGKVKAQAIVTYRETNGRFTSLEQLLKVKGIGEKFLVDNMSNITI